MSKYVKELMMDQLKSELDGSRSVLIVDLKGLDAIAEHQLRRDLRKKSIKIRALKNTLARRVFSDLGMEGLSRFLVGPSTAVWGGDGVAELAKEMSRLVKTLKKPQIKGGAVDGVVIGPEQVEDITKLPSREALIARVAGLAMAPAQRVVALANAPASNLQAQLKTLAEGAEPEPEGEGEGEAAAPEGEGEGGGEGEGEAAAPAEGA
jgi:large subunit ribosomal protein L10